MGTTLLLSFEEEESEIEAAGFSTPLKKADRGVGPALRTPSAVKTEMAPPAATSASPRPAQTATPLSPEPPPTRYPGDDASKEAVIVLSLGLTEVQAVPASEEGMESCKPGVDASGSKGAGAVAALAAAVEAASAGAGAEASESAAFSAAVVGGGAAAATAASAALAAPSASSFLGDVSTVFPSASPGRT